MNHDEDKQSSWMMWAMMLCCALPLFILIFSLGGRALGASTLVIFDGIAVVAVAHFFTMGKVHKHSDEEQTMTAGENKSNQDNKTHSGHGCCH